MDQPGKVRKRNNSVIQIADGSFMKIEELLHFYDERYNNMEYLMLGKKFELANGDVLCEYGNWTSENFCRKVLETEQIICCSLEEIKKNFIFFQ